MSLSVITDVFSEIIDWIITALQSVLAVFYTPGVGDAAGSLTFLGVLAVAGLAISVFFLIMGVIQNFLHFRG